MPINPFEFLENAGSHTNTWISIYGPLGLGLILAGVAAIVIKIRRNRERRELEVAFREVSAAATEEIATEVPKGPAIGIGARFRAGLGRTREFFESGAKSIFSGRIEINGPVLEKLHEILYRADIGVKTVDRLIDGVKRTLGGHDADWESVKAQIALEAKGIFDEAKKGPLNVPLQGPWVILVIGVNGVGKTTTIGKLAAKFKGQGKTVMLCAADTFRAAAIEQLQVWGERNDVPVIKQHPGADPAAVAFDGVQAAKARNIDVLIIDTAGRLHSKIELMAELSKINKSIGKDLVGAPHETWIVLDATTGQNAFQQCKAFSEVTALSGIIMTKLDGTAKGGVIIGIADQFKLPIRFIGLGEKVDDLREFSGDEFVDGLF